MCTAITYKTADHYFGRNLDLEFSYQETITITPRNFPFLFRSVPTLNTHYAMIGMAYVANDYPLYYDATNEKGLSMAGLNFPDNAFYPDPEDGAENIAPFELIPWILGQCSDIAETKTLLSRTRVVNIHFSARLPLTPLHWIIADRKEAIVLEAMKDGLMIHDNPVGVLTNNPPFPFQLFHLNQYMSLSTGQPVNHFSDKLDFSPYSRGMGALGMPGDLSSPSRFVRAAFTRLNSVSKFGETASVSQFFHILSSVEQQRGCVRLGQDQYEITVYSSCCNTDKGIYYYTTYDNRQINGVDIHAENLDSDTLISYPLIKEQQLLIQNRHKALP